MNRLKTAYHATTKENADKILEEGFNTKKIFAWKTIEEAYQWCKVSNLDRVLIIDYRPGFKRNYPLYEIIVPQKDKIVGIY